MLSVALFKTFSASTNYLCNLGSMNSPKMAVMLVNRHVVAADDRASFVYYAGTVL